MGRTNRSTAQKASSSGSWCPPLEDAGVVLLVEVAVVGEVRVGVR